jgi:murein DD-endopeptidase MepM/ murein hydrolase activator NlpD
LLNAAVRARDALRRLRPDRTTSNGTATTLRYRSVGAGPSEEGTTRSGRPAHARPIDRGGRRSTGARRLRLGERVGAALGRLATRPVVALRSGPRLGDRERLLPIVVALLVLVGSLSSIARPAPTGAVGGTTSGDQPRLAIAGLEADTTGIDSGVGVDGYDPGAARLDPAGDGDLSAANAPEGPYLADGTLLKPIAVDTTVDDGASTLREYRVRSGDTLTGIARHFGLSMMTLWWANHLKSKDALHVGQKLVIPPVDGTVHVVLVGETLAGIAKKAGVSTDDVVTFNGLTDQTVVVGQTLVLPGSHGAPIPTPKPKPRPVYASRSTSGGSSGGRTSTPRSYGGGVFAWPVPGGYISQYFHYGHPAIDIAAPYGSRIVSAASGTVIFAGWKNNGGGYQVYVAHGSGLFTAYNHMSAITVRVGEHVGRGEQVGRVGMTGSATGPHCHFEVWRGEVWGSGYRVNPLSYL